MTARVLIIAGSDSGGGAGIQADIKAVTMLGGHAMTAITAITAQNTLGVQAVHPVPTAMVLAQIDNPALLTRKRVALLAKERVPVREPAVLENLDGQQVGQVTSGLLSPTLNQPIAMAYVQPDCAAVDTELFALVRGKRVPMVVAPTPFVPTRYHRG